MIRSAQCLVFLLPLLVACAETEGTPSDPSAPAAEAAEPEPAEAVSEPVYLGIPPRQIVRARQEAAGLYRMPSVLRAQTLEARAAEGPTYEELRADADGHARDGVSFAGRVGLVRSAGPRLWIMALHTRSVEGRWADPLYVISAIPPMLPAEGGAVARVYGWVVGERTIGAHALPLVLAYYVERLDEPEGSGSEEGGERDAAGPKHELN